MKSPGKSINEINFDEECLIGGVLAYLIKLFPFWGPYWGVLRKLPF